MIGRSEPQHFRPLAMKRDPWLLAFLAIVLACIEFRLDFLICGYSVEGQAEQVFNITRGLPDWEQWQNRLIGPWLFRWSSEVLGEPSSSLYPFFLLALRIAKNVLFGFLLFRLKRDAVLCMRYLLLFSFVSLATLDAMHLYPWDYLDIMVFSLFLFGVFRGAGVAYFTALFLPALFNRESALFIPLWMVLDSVRFPAGEQAKRVRFHVDARTFIVGAALLGAGGATVHLLRRALLVRELGPAGNPEFAADGAIHFGWNMDFLLHNWFDVSPSMNCLKILFFVAFPLFFVVIRKKMGELQRNLAAIVAAMWIMILVLGLVWETRGSSMLLPFAVLLPFHHFHLRQRAGRYPPGEVSDSSAP